MHRNVPAPPPTGNRPGAADGLGRCCGTHSNHKTGDAWGIG